LEAVENIIDPYKCLPSPSPFTLYPLPFTSFISEYVNLWLLTVSSYPSSDIWLIEEEARTYI
jgi:hypothetical protein